MKLLIPRKELEEIVISHWAAKSPLIVKEGAKLTPMKLRSYEPDSECYEVPDYYIIEVFITPL